MGNHVGHLPHALLGGDNRLRRSKRRSNPLALQPIALEVIVDCIHPLGIALVGLGAYKSANLNWRNRGGPGKLLNSGSYPVVPGYVGVFSEPKYIQVGG